MNREEILKRCIEKAVEGGYGKELYRGNITEYWSISCEVKEYWFLNMYSNEYCYKIGKKLDYFGLGTELEILFDQNFCKAFWGDGRVCALTGEKLEYNPKRTVNVLLAWQYHGQQLFLAEDRIKYLEQFINSKGE